MNSRWSTVIALAALAVAPLRAEEPTWTRGFGTRSHDLAFGLAAAGDGGVYLGGIYRGRFALSAFDLEGAFEPVGPNDSAIVALAPDGSGRWARAIGGNGVTEIRTIATDADGVVATGYFLDDLAVDGLPSTRSQGGADGFIAAFAADGTPRWTRTFGGKGADLAMSAVAVGDGIVLVGQFEQAARFGDGADGTPRVLRARGGKDFYVAQLDADGRVTHAQAIGGAGDDRAVAVAAAPDGGFVVLAMHRGGFAACGVDVATHGGDDGLLLRFDADGQCVASRAIGRAAHETWDAMAVADDGAVWIGGLLVGEPAEIAFGDQRKTLSSKGSSDVVLARFDDALALTHAFTIGNEGADTVHAIVADRSGQVLVAASGTGKLSLGELSRDAAVPHAYVARFGPEANAIAVADVAARGITQATGLAALPGDRFAMLGLFEDAIERPGEDAAPAIGRTDAFVTVRTFR